MSEVEYHRTDYGFQYGSMEVERQHSRDDGSVYLSIKTPKNEFDIYATKTGKVRFFKQDGEYVLVKVVKDVEDVTKVFLEAANNPWRKFPDEKPTEIKPYLVCVKVRKHKFPFWMVKAWSGGHWLSGIGDSSEVIAWKEGPELPNE